MGKYDHTDWFRSSTWSESVASAFETKLRRAHTDSRPQYVRIQGVHLIEQTDPAARQAGRELLHRVIDEYGDDELQSVWAAESLADALTSDNRLEESEALTRALVARRDRDPSGWRGGRTDLDLALAEILLNRGDADSLREADERLEQGGEEVQRASMFRNLVLRHLVARARVAARLGDRERARHYAREALDVAAETTSPLPRHPNVGRPDPTTDLIGELGELSSGVD